MVSKNIVLLVYSATSKIVNSAKGIKSVVAEANKILSQTLNIHIRNHLAEGRSKK